LGRRGEADHGHRRHGDVTVKGPSPRARVLGELAQHPARLSPMCPLHPSDDAV
jgi:hypothetical protein